MTEEEILLAAQTEHEETGEYEQAMIRKSFGYGAAFGVGVCMLLMLAEIFIAKRFDYGKPVIIFSLAGFASTYEGIKNQNKKKLRDGIVLLILAVIGFALYIGALFS